MPHTRYPSSPLPQFPTLGYISPMSIPVSACIICKNEVRRIAGALDSLAWCPDVVVVDSGSTDGTVEAAQNHPSRPRVIHQDWLGYNPQRRFSAEQCLHPWVLMLDADEECTPELAREIQAITEERTQGVGIFLMPRKNYIGGRYIRCWSPDYQARLIHKERVEWSPLVAPEFRSAKPGFREVKLKHPMLHGRFAPFAMVDINDGKKIAEYAELYAQTLQRSGKHPTYLNLLFRPILAFLKYYLVKGAFLDGRFGLVIAYKTTMMVMLKYSVLYAKEELEKPPSLEKPSLRSRDP